VWVYCFFRKGVAVEEKKVYVEIPEFTGENVPVAVAARVMKKDQQFIRQVMRRVSFLTSTNIAIPTTSTDVETASDRLYGAYRIMIDGG